MPSTSSVIKNALRPFSHFTTIQILFYILLVWVSAMIVYRGFSLFYPEKEGFDTDQSSEDEEKGTLDSKYVNKTGTDIYDTFYANLYDELVYSASKNNFDVGEITALIGNDNNGENVMLDIGSGTGHHVDAFSKTGAKVIGIDISPSMVKKAKENYPGLDFRVGNALDTMVFSNNYFTHISCLYFTIYYIKDKRTFFSNCMNWLLPGGYLVVNLVDKYKFDPILPAGNPFTLVSPQNYADKRITTTAVKFHDYDYKSNFDLNEDLAIFKETFKYKKNQKVRVNEHVLYMPTIKAVLAMAKDSGFIVSGEVDMGKIGYEYQYLYILQKPT
jgi:SAM-dependent methyltransferase